MERFQESDLGNKIQEHFTQYICFEITVDNQ